MLSVFLVLPVLLRRIGLGVILSLVRWANTPARAIGQPVHSLPGGGSVIVIHLPAPFLVPAGGWTGYPQPMATAPSTGTEGRCAASMGQAVWLPPTTYSLPRSSTIPAVGILEHRQHWPAPIQDYAPGSVPFPPGSVMRQRQLSISGAAPGGSTPRAVALPSLPLLRSCPGGQCPLRSPISHDVALSVRRQGRLPSKSTFPDRACSSPRARPSCRAGPTVASL